MKFIIALVLSIFVALFALQNSEQVQVSILFYTFTPSLAVVILSSAVLGAIIAFMLGLVKQFSLSRHLREKKKSIAKLESELDMVKTQLNDAETKLSNEIPPASPLLGERRNSSDLSLPSEEFTEPSTESESESNFMA
ncbi:MAG: LapA family protein [Peptostreptococcaceae bacterium]|nr:LapA family protein [Peptostreptococcaceae bacterium]